VRKRERERERERETETEKLAKQKMYSGERLLNVLVYAYRTVCRKTSVRRK